MKIFLAFFFVACAQLACATEVQLTISHDQSRWDGYPDNLEVVKAEWVSGVLKGRVVVTATSTSIPVSRNAWVIVSGSHLTLCYEKEGVKYEEGQPIAAAAWPVILEFKVVGLAQENYVMSVSHQCRY